MDEYFKGMIENRKNDYYYKILYENRNKNTSQDKTIEDIFKLYNDPNKNTYENQCMNEVNFFTNDNYVEQNFMIDDLKEDRKENNNIENIQQYYNMNTINTMNTINAMNNINNNNQEEQLNNINNIRLGKIGLLEDESEKRKKFILLSILLFIFPPVGLYLIIKKLDNKEKKNILLLSGTITIILYIFLYFIMSSIFNNYLLKDNKYNIKDDYQKINNFLITNDINIGIIKSNDLIIDENEINKTFYIDKVNYKYRIIMNKKNQITSITKIDNYNGGVTIIY